MLVGRLSEYSLCMEKILRLKLAAELGEHAVILRDLSASQVCFVTLAVTDLVLNWLDARRSRRAVASEFLEDHFYNWFESLCLYLSGTLPEPLPSVLAVVSDSVAELDRNTGLSVRLYPQGPPGGEFMPPQSVQQASKCDL